MLKELKGANSTYRANDRRRRRRFLRVIVGISLTIIIICTVLGLGYVWYMGKTRPVEQATVTKTKSIKPEVSAAPVIAEDAPVGVAVQTLTTPVKQGGNSSISVRTRPQAACSIRVTYSLEEDKSKESVDGGLIPKTADQYGTVSWTWTVEAGRPVGSWPVKVTCAYKDNWGVGKDMLEVIE